MKKMTLTLPPEMHKKVTEQLRKNRKVGNKPKHLNTFVESLIKREWMATRTEKGAV